MTTHTVPTSSDAPTRPQLPEWLTDALLAHRVYAVKAGDSLRPEGEPVRIIRPESAASGETLTKAQLAEAVGVSQRTLDNHLRDGRCVAAIGAYKTSACRNAHWRFPANAPELLRTHLRRKES